MWRFNDYILLFSIQTLKSLSDARMRRWCTDHQIGLSQLSCVSSLLTGPLGIRSWSTTVCHCRKVQPSTLVPYRVRTQITGNRERAYFCFRRAHTHFRGPDLANAGSSHASSYTWQSSFADPCCSMPAFLRSTWSTASSPWWRTLSERAFHGWCRPRFWGLLARLKGQPRH